MNTKCNYSNLVFDLYDNILKDYKFNPIYYTDDKIPVQPYNEQAQGLMPYKSKNIPNTDKPDTYLKYAQDNSVKDLESIFNKKVSDILNRNYNIKTDKMPFSDRGGNN